MHILLILLLILFLIPTILLSIVSWILSLFGFRSRKKWHSMGGRGFYYDSDTSHESHKEEKEYKRKEKRKIFDKDEGEYVDFEEIK